MRHNYQTRAIVLARTPLGEANALVTLLTADLGLVRARAQGVRKSSAKLAAALMTFAESDVTLVRGKEGWRIVGASLATHWHRALPQVSRVRATRITGLLLRLVAGETAEPALFLLLRGFFAVLAAESESSHDAAECLAALRLLAALGLDAGEVPGASVAHYESELLTQVALSRLEFVVRINRGIAASGL